MPHLIDYFNDPEIASLAALSRNDTSLNKEFLLPLNNTKLSSSSHRIETNKPIILSPRKVITLYINEQHQT